MCRSDGDVGRLRCCLVCEDLERGKSFAVSKMYTKYLEAKVYSVCYESNAHNLASVIASGCIRIALK